MLELGLTWPAETFLQGRFAGLRRRGVEIVVAATYDTRGRQDPSLDDVEVHHVPSWEEPRWRVVAGLAHDIARAMVRRPLGLGRVLRATAAEGRPLSWPTLRRMRMFAALVPLRADIVHVEWESTAVVYTPLLDAWRAPVVISCHGGLHVSVTAPDRQRIVRRLPEAFEKAAAVHCVSRAVQHVAVSHGLAPAKVRVIRTAVDAEDFPPTSGHSTDDALRVVAVGWLRWVKGYEYAVEALGRLRARGVPARLDIYGGDPLPPLGEPSERLRLITAIDDLALGDCVELHGHTPPNAVASAIREADALLLSSVSEGLPTVVLEAMASGISVVATDCGGVREAVTDGDEGFVVPIRDADRMADALEKLWRDPRRRLAMGHAGRDHAVRDFALDDHIDAFVALYEEVIARIDA